VITPTDPTDPTEMAAFNKNVVDEFRAYDGKVDGVFEEGTMALLHHAGARSGVERVTPLGYFTDGDRIFVVASFGGSDVNPAWYGNLLANPRTTVEIGSEIIPVTARELTGAERDERFAKIAETMPMFADYQRKTTRVIPSSSSFGTDRPPAPSCETFLIASRRCQFGRACARRLFTWLRMQMLMHGGNCWEARWTRSPAAMWVIGLPVTSRIARVTTGSRVGGARNPADTRPHP
jgi:deazaflavin-dependent oxidoreductase (nitroreductase family)